MPSVAKEWQDFETRWPFHPSEDRQRAFRAFAKLTGADRLAALAGVDGHLGRCERDGEKRGTARAFITGRMFERCMSAGAVGQAKSEVFVPKGSDAWRAWERHWKRDNPGRPMFAFASREHGAEGTMRPTLYPPGSPPVDRPEDRSADVGSAAEGSHGVSRQASGRLIGRPTSRCDMAARPLASAGRNPSAPCLRSPDDHRGSSAVRRGPIAASATGPPSDGT